MTKKAMVTGASEGIGRAFAKRLADEGYQVIAVARNKGRLEELMKEMQGSGHSYQVADLSSEEGVKRISELLGREHQDLLVNNAGFGLIGKFHETPLEKFQEMTRLNCDALVALSHAFLRSSVRGDALVNISSTLAFLPMPINGLYAATKAFVTSFSESLWYEQRDRGVYVVGVCPGLTATQFHTRAGVKSEDRIPAALTQAPEQVVDAAMSALKRRTAPTVISGAKNRAMASFSRLLPRKAMVSIMGKMEG